MPDITLRTTVICGFPGETEAQFAELFAFLEEAKFQRLGAFAVASNSMSDTLATINQMGKNDVLVVISHSGTTMDAEQVIQVGAMHGVITVMITSYPDAPAAKHAQYLVKTYAPETPYGRSGTASRVSQFVVLDALYTILTAQNDPVLYSELREQHKRTLEVKKGH